MEAARRTSSAELFWDLVFVFAVTEVTTLLRSDLTWPGFGRAMLILALVWWAWSAFVWVINAQDPDSNAVRAVLLVSTGLILVAGLAVPHAFGRDGTTFAVAYVCVRLAHLGLYVDASRRGNASPGAIAGFGVPVLIGMALLLAGSFFDGGTRVALWVAAAAIDYAGPLLTRRRLRGLQELAVEHFAERYGLFIMICLGESIVAVGFGAERRRLDGQLIAGVALMLAITAELWWMYFSRFAALAQERLAALSEPVLAASDGYAYLHLLIVAGIIVFAVGAREAVAAIGAPLGEAARLSLCAGVALYLLGVVAFGARVLGAIGWAKLVAAAGCLALFALAGGAAAWVDAAALVALLAGLLAWEHSRGVGERPASVLAA